MSDETRNGSSSPSAAPVPPLVEGAYRDWKEFVRALEWHDYSWIFRGQSDARWTLKTSLERHAPREQAAALSEVSWLYEFKRRVHLYVRAEEMAEDTVGWMALMQHFGAPTRLLDFTRSPYVAAYFAVEDGLDKTDENPDPHCAVWAVNEVWCSEVVGRMLRTSTPEYASVIDSVRAKVGSAASNVDIAFASLLRNGAGFDAAFLQGNRKMAVPVEPLKLSERLSIQQGAFLAAASVNDSFMNNLAAMDGWTTGVRKFTLSLAQRARALEDLRKMNITRASLFPGLDGFAQSFRQLLIREPPSIRGLRSAVEGDPTVRGWLSDAGGGEGKP